MKTIWKYRVEPRAGFTVHMPANAKILCVQIQNGLPYFWAEVDSDEALIAHPFMIVGTGQDLPQKAHKYVGTWQAGEFVWHLYNLGV